MNADYRKGSKKDVAEIKFLIHDLRVRRFINEIIHFHVTLNTDLEIYSIEQAQILHGEDLQALKSKAVSLRKAYQDYSNAVRSFSPDQTILNAGYKFVQTIQSTCELILNPLWGRIDKVLAFLPPESRSVRSRDSYQNSIRWMGGVARRIRHFLDEQQKKDLYEAFDIAEEIENYTRDVIEGYVKEKGGASMRLQLNNLDSALIGGSRYRFRRMYFNLIMNAVDAMANRKVGVLDISDTLNGDQVVLRVRDNGVGMAADKIAQLLEEKETLDGELHSLGFVFVRQTIAEFGGELAIESEVDEGTTVSVTFPRLPGDAASVRRMPSPQEDVRLSLLRGAREDTLVLGSESEASKPALAKSDEAAATPTPETTDMNRYCGRMIYEAYQRSDAQHPGSIFGIALNEDSTIEFFTNRGYDRYSNVTHADLSPMFFESTLRGRLEEDELGRLVLTLKEPQNVREYFEFKNIPEQDRSPSKHVQMVHDEYVRVARKLIETGLPSETRVELTGLRKFFPGQVELAQADLFPLELLAKQALSTE